jgi:beta-lactamase class A
MTKRKSGTARGKSATGAIEAEIRRIAAPIGGTVGVATRRLDGNGPEIAVNGNEPFPMASSYKIAIACAVLKKVDAGELALDRMLDVPHDKVVESTVLAENFLHPGVCLSIHNLLEIMLTHSDNSATDVLFAVAGGGRAVTSGLRELGIRGQRVDRDTAGIIGDFQARLAKARKRNPRLDDILNSLNPSFDDDPRDSSTPLAMADLLGRIFRGEALSKKSTGILIAIMERCRTGPARLKGRLPPGTIVAHKTGTIGGTANDVGVVTLPDNRGRIAIVVFTKKSEAPLERREAVIADIARSVRDFYLFGN